MSQAGQFALGTRKAIARTLEQAGPLLVAVVVRVSGGVYVNVAGEAQDRGPLDGQTTGIAVGDSALIGIPANSANPVLVTHW